MRLKQVQARNVPQVNVQKVGFPLLYPAKDSMDGAQIRRLACRRRRPLPPWLCREFLTPVANLLPVHPDRPRRCDADSSFVALNGYDRNENVAVDYDLFADPSREHKHVRLLHEKEKASSVRLQH
jgi:hypothetical protein